MSYTVCNVLDLGEAYTGVTLNAQLYDSSNSMVGSAVTTGFYERDGSKGIYTLTLTVPDAHQGWFDVYVDGASSDILATLPINPAELENADVKTSTRSAVADIMSFAMMSARQFQDVIMDIWAVVVGNASANDATNPTSISYQNVVTGGQVTHILDDTTRTID